uniref:Uncharacterized protein n=2 Tax=Anopheles albimanus TaxID=7167 RepID=A0A182FZH1_ANOAL
MRLGVVLVTALLAISVEARKRQVSGGGESTFLSAQRRGETQFMHEASIGATRLGCYGYVDVHGDTYTTHYLADETGNHIISLEHPDKLTRERVASLRNGEDGPVSDVFPKDCTEEGAYGRLKKLADNIKQELENGKDETATPQPKADNDFPDSPKKNPGSSRRPSKSSGNNQKKPTNVDPKKSNPSEKLSKPKDAKPHSNDNHSSKPQSIRNKQRPSSYNAASKFKPVYEATEPQTTPKELQRVSGKPKSDSKSPVKPN